MEVYFLDVGQGTSQLILTGNREAIVIDAGPSTDTVLLRALARYSIDRILLLIITHSHADHTAAADRVLTTYSSRIGEIWFLDDYELKKSQFYNRIRSLLDSGEIDEDQLCRLERENTPKPIYVDEVRNLELSIASPTFAENLHATDKNNPNATSAVIVLKVYSSCIVFASDSTIGQWRTMAAMYNKPLICDVLAVPHHGGLMEQASDEDIRWLYSDAIKPLHAVISVGTRGGARHGHPNQVVIDMLRMAGSSVLCTQITDRCCSDLEVVRPGLMSPLEPIRQSKPTKSIDRRLASRQVACAGTVVAELSPQNCIVRHLASHQDGVNRLAAADCGNPMCRSCFAPLQQ